MDTPDALDPHNTPGVSSRRRRWAKRLGWALAAVIAPLVLALLALNSPLGKRFIADQIASYAPASGLQVEVGRIRGDIYRAAVLQDVVLSDPQGPFLTIPEVELDWRPLSWLGSGLDIRKLVARRGRLERWPQLLPGDPDAPILPDFDIRVDRLEIDNLALAPGVATDRRERVDLTASADIRDGLVALSLDGRLGRTDRVELALDAEPDGDRFDLELDYDAPAGGVIAGLTGAEAGYRARVTGEGGWSDWLGHALVKRGEETFAAMRLTNRAGRYAMIGQVYPPSGDDLLSRALGEKSGVVIAGTFENSRFEGTAKLRSAVLALSGAGAIDLAQNRADGFRIDAALLDPAFFGEAAMLRSASLRAVFDGPFAEMEIEHRFTAARLALGEAVVVGLRQQGVAQWGTSGLRVPLALRIGRVETGSEVADAELVSGTIAGQLAWRDGAIRAAPLRASFPRLSARLALKADPAAGAFELSGPVRLRQTAIADVGAIAADGRISFALRQNSPWRLEASLQGSLGEIPNATLRNLAGESLAWRTQLAVGESTPLTLDTLHLESAVLSLDGAASWAAGHLAIEGRGDHARYGAFTFDAALGEVGPQAVLVLASPLPAAGLADVRLALAPEGDSLRIETSGQSLLGEFGGELRLTSQPRGPTVLDIVQLRVWKTGIEGQLQLEAGGARGRLALTGGGIDGALVLTPVEGVQRFSAELVADKAVFGGATALELGQARIAASGDIGDGASRLEATLSGRGIRYGRLFLGRVAARAQLEDGEGTLAASLVGRQGGRFSLQLHSDIAPAKVALALRGNYAGTPIAMARRAVMTREAAGGWVLAPAQLSIGEGRAAVSGTFGGDTTRLELGLVEVPLALGDLAMRDLGLGGTASGLVHYSDMPSSPPSGEIRLKLEGLTRAGLTLASRPIDMSLVASLGPADLGARAVIESEGERAGWVDAQITGLPLEGSLYERLERGALDAQVQYEGAAEALWRLAAIDALDLAGPVTIRAEARGSLADPRVRGNIASRDLRVRSGLSGTDISQLRMAGDFEGSRLFLRRFEGMAAGGGAITGSGTIDLAEMGPDRGPRIDLRAAAREARLLDARGLSATVTGPLRIISDGIGGTIAGRLEIDRASWQLGSADEDVSLPQIATREINLPADLDTSSRPVAPWRYLIDARSRGRIDVDGMGLDSEWRADIILRGTTDDPRIGGAARVVRGSYSFAGTRFELTRGRIGFDENVPIDPRLDIAAQTSRGGLDVTVTVRGSALAPEIAFSSEPPLPEEDILARLLFGGAITELSPTDALQLGAAIASLRGGGGMDPINRLRSAIGLDRLRIVGADPALGRETGVALGENLGRRFYVELVTDGRGYSATMLEFRITSWLSLLGSVSTLGRESVLVEVSRDY